MVASTTRADDWLGGIDALRVLAAIFVIFIHIPQHNDLAITSDIIARWAVPFFFAAAGYLAASNNRSPIVEVRRLLRRIGIPYLFWVAIYCAFLLPGTSELSVKDIARIVLLGGPAIHLWFLPALAMALVFFRCIQRCTTPKLFILAAVVYAAGLIVGAYRPANLDLPFNPRNGPFLSVPMVIIGALYRRRPPVDLSVAVVAVVASFLMYAAEVHFLHPRALDQTGTTFLIGYTPLMVGLTWKDRITEYVGNFGKYSFGVYLTHVGVLTLLQRIFYPQSGVQTLCFVFIIAIASFAVSAALWHTPYVRALVR